MAFTLRASLCTTNALPGLRAAHVRSFHTSIPLASSSKFSYAIAASYAAKNALFYPERDVFNFNPESPIFACRVIKSTRPASGQDAFFISRVGSSSDVAFGVTDGVGGWADSCVDPADFAHGICDYMAHAASVYQVAKPELGDLTPRTLLQRGYHEIMEDTQVRAGGSTACVGIAKSNGTLQVANLGDSGYMLLRPNAVHAYSEAQTHAFNTPYQLSKIPKKFLEQSLLYGGSQLMDSPTDANTYENTMRHGDVLVFATDGVWDNMSHSDVLRVVSKIMVEAKAWEHTANGMTISRELRLCTLERENPEGVKRLWTLQKSLAVTVTGAAKAASLNDRVNGPFGKAIQKFYPDDGWRGGKKDDICALIAIVLEDGK